MQRRNKSAEKIADCKGIKRIMGKIKKWAGFTLIEVTIAIFVLIIIVGSVLMLLSSSYANLRESEAKNIAKNIGSYTVEYIRSRNVTADNPLGHIPNEFGNDSSHDYPGLIDLWGLPVQSNGWPYEGAGEFKKINVNPATPDEKYQDRPFAFCFSLQGYVSLRDLDQLAASDPSLQDANAYICDSDTEHYHDRLYKVAPSVENGHTMYGNHYLIRFPFDSTSLDAIKNFVGGPTYIPMVYTADANKLSKSSSEYDPHYTNIASDKSKTMDYNGFRVLTSIVARKKNASDPDHVQYYDVKVTVLWITGGNEHEYSLATQIVTY